PVVVTPRHLHEPPGIREATDLRTRAEEGEILCARDAVLALHRGARPLQGHVHLARRQRCVSHEQQQYCRGRDSLHRPYHLGPGAVICWKYLWSTALRH